MIKSWLGGLSGQKFVPSTTTLKSISIFPWVRRKCSLNSSVRSLLRLKSRDELIIINNKHIFMIYAYLWTCAGACWHIRSRKPLAASRSCSARSHQKRTDHEWDVSTAGRCRKSGTRPYPRRNLTVLSTGCRQMVYISKPSKQKIHTTPFKAVSKSQSSAILFIFRRSWSA